MADLAELYDMRTICEEPEYPDILADLAEIDLDKWICDVRRHYAHARLSGWPEKAAAAVVLQKLKDADRGSPFFVAGGRDHGDA